MSALGRWHGMISHFQVTD